MMKGWKILPFSEVVEECSKGNAKIPQGNYLAKGAYAIVDQGRGLIGGYTDDYESVWQGELPVVIFGDHTRCLKFVDFEFCMGADGVKVLAPKKFVSAKYLYHFLKYLNIKSVGYSRHFKYLKDCKISFPESAEDQKKIVAALDLALDLREKCLASMKSLQELSQAVFDEMFGDAAQSKQQWSPVTVGEMLESATYGTSEKAGSEGAYPILRMGNVTAEGEIDLGDLKYIDIDEAVRERYLVRSGDILFNRTNSAELVGKSAIYRGVPSVAYAGYLIRLRVNTENDPEYLAAFMNSRHAKKLLRNMCKSIVGMANINAKEVQSIKLARPPLAMQEIFAEKVRSIEELKSICREQMSELDALYASLQHRAFRGEL